MISIIAFALVIGAGVLVAQISQRIRLRRQRQAAEAASKTLLEQINKLKMLRYCVSEHCPHCIRLPRPEDCDACLFARKCDQRVHHPCEEGNCQGTAEMDCAICLADFLDGDALRLLPCRHIFHAACADKWLARPGDGDPSCPKCKRVAFRMGGGESAHRQLWRARVASVAPEATAHEPERNEEPAVPDNAFTV